MCIYQRQHTKALSNLTVGCEFHYVIRRTVQCFADLSHGFNRDIFIPGHFENDIVADARSLFKVFLLHIPVNQQFPELSASIQTGSTRKIGTVGLGCLKYKYHISRKNATVYKAMDLILVFLLLSTGREIRHDDRGFLLAPHLGFC